MDTETPNQEQNHLREFTEIIGKEPMSTPENPPHIEIIFGSNPDTKQPTVLGIAIFVKAADETEKSPIVFRYFVNDSYDVKKINFNTNGLDDADLTTLPTEYTSAYNLIPRVGKMLLVSSLYSHAANVNVIAKVCVDTARHLQGLPPIEEETVSQANAQDGASDAPEAPNPKKKRRTKKTKAETEEKSEA